MKQKQKQKQKKLNQTHENQFCAVGKLVFTIEFNASQQLRLQNSIAKLTN